MQMLVFSRDGDGPGRKHEIEVAAAGDVRIRRVISILIPKQGHYAYLAVPVGYDDSFVVDEIEAVGGIEVRGRNLGDVGQSYDLPVWRGRDIDVENGNDVLVEAKNGKPAIVW